MKELVRRGLGAAASSPPARGPLRRRLAGSRCIVYYHHVGPPVPWYASFDCGVTAARLDADLTRLSRFVRFAPLADVLAAGEPAPGERPLCAVTFDDGLRGDAEPVLERHGAAATSFVITRCVDNRHLMWRHALSAALAERPGAAVRAFDAVQREEGLAPAGAPGAVQGAAAAWPMDGKDRLAAAVWERAGMPAQADYLAEHRPYVTWEELGAWRARGHGVGLHTATHPQCDRLTAQELRAEVDDAAHELRGALGLDAVDLSWPFGRRPAPALERELLDRGAVGHALGIDGLSPLGADPARAERAAAEAGVGYHVFARALLRRA